VRFSAYLLVIGLMCAAFVEKGACEDPVAHSGAPSAESAGIGPSHHTDKGFRNPWGLRQHNETPVRVTLPFFLRRVGSTFGGDRGAPPPRIPADLELIEQVADDAGYSVTWVGHSTFLVQMAGVRFLTDPTWSKTASPLPVGPRRFVEPGMDLDELGRIDFVVISHNHYDHLDIGTLKTLADRGTTFFTPLANAKTLERHGIGPVIEMDWWQKHELAGAEVHCMPARHWSRRGIMDMDRALWSGWFVKAGDRKFFFAGDTGMFPGFAEIGAKLGPIDLAAIPIGAYEPREMMEPAHLNPEEAIEAVVALRAERSMAMHFGTFDLTDEPIDEPPKRYQAASLEARRGPEVDWVLSIGETRRF
jgi:N-acyl-phosphatidylethanolamine-hydrolysing phospholipase D